MGRKLKHIIIYTFQSLEDPLVKGLVLEYLKNLDEKEIIFHIITHEQKEYALASDKVAVKRAELKNLNIEWYPVKYRSGSFLLIKKLFNFLQTFFISWKIKRKYKPVAIMGFLAIAGGYSYIISKLLRLKLIVYCFEPHSEYMIDFKIWKVSDMKYKLLKKYEQLQIKNADFVVVPNNYTKSLVENSNSVAELLVCPISISTDTMLFDADARNNIRKKLNAESRTIIIYTGKFDGIYYSTDEVVNFFSKLYKADNSFFFYVITPNIVELKASVAKYKLPSDSIAVSLTVNYSELNQHVSAADIGFVALPPLPSQKYRTPVKTAIYLSCGLPYIVNKNIGEDDIIASSKNVGVVIEDLNESPASVSKKITALLSDTSDLRQRCRQEAVNTRSIAAANSVLKKIFSKL